MSKNFVWLAGRGVSMSCGLCWDVPPPLERAFRHGEIEREALIAEVCAGLERAQREVDPAPVRALLRGIRESCAAGWHHAFVTTNWDTLLDRVLREEGFAPALHLNGSIAAGDLLFETDSAERRDAAPEARAAMRRLLEADGCVVAGLSLGNALDKGLIARLAAKDGGRWWVVNHDAGEVRHACRVLAEQLPRAMVAAIEEPFDRWVQAGLPGILPR